jgi:polyisoprenoid-binding protein YceI
MKAFWIRMLLPFYIVVVYLSLGITGVSAQLNASHQSGTVVFAGQHAGMNFEGAFERWQAILVLPPQSEPSVTATFYLNSAKTGDSIYDSTLAEFDWFDVENHGAGHFFSTKVEVNQDGYQVWGNLTLKDITKPINFMMIDNGDKLIAHFDINRLDYQIGLESDPDAEWVSKSITISMVINK